MKRKIQIFLGCVITICLTLGLLVYVDNLTELKLSKEKYSDFIEQEEDFDVLFLGSSHVVNGIFPMELWNDYGIVSYNLGASAGQIPTTYWVFRNALDYTNPKVVVIDCLFLSGNFKTSDRFSYTHLALDGFPLTKTKIEAVTDLLDDKALDRAVMNGEARSGGEKRTKLGLLWDYTVYHSRWNELEERDFSDIRNKNKGAEACIAVNGEPLNRIDKSIKSIGGTVGLKYLRRMIEECQERGIEVLLTFLPFTAEEWYQQESNYVYELAEEYNVNYINFLDEEVIDYEIDMADIISHLNPAGARKVTKYLGKYLVENYDVQDNRNDSKYQSWFEDYDEYCEYKDATLQSERDLINYLMLLIDDDLDITMRIEDTSIFNDRITSKMLANLGIDTNEIGDNTELIVIKDRGKNVNVINKTDSRYNSLAEDIQISNNDTDIKIVVKRDKKLVDDVEFNCYLETSTKTYSAIR